MKKLITLLLCLVLVLGCAAPVFGADFEGAAQELKDVGLFMGTNEGFELDRAATRCEAAVMLVRLLGQENAAKAQWEAGDNTHPFSDVPSWADAYVAWLYQAALTKGISADKFGTSDCTAQMYCTFAMRALGYSEEAEDFTYVAALEKASELGIYDTSMVDSFLRDEVVAVSYQSLATDMKGTGQSLLEKLVADGAVSASAAAPLLEKQSLYKEYAEACSKSEEYDAVEMDSAVDMKVKSAVAEENVELAISSHVKTIMRDDSLQMEIISETEIPDLGKTPLNEWYKDGWLYIETAQGKIKTEMSLEEAMVAMKKPGSIMNANPIFGIEKIEKNTDGSFTLTMNDVMDSIVNEALGVSGSDAVKDMKIKDMVTTIWQDKGGNVSKVAVSFEASMTVTTDKDGSHTMSYSYSSMNNVKAWGDKVTIAYPDFSDYAENVTE